ncbi:helix-turn-helix transcriptional regulator [Parapusillimonas granuli]|uniref:Helix-turn-helix transcriptional regulator n=1 Tax=Parapusillimonas granuli TaxID=380911 RepID=A0A853FZL5_9BURK|nr:helix-turn-helix transcriptional regulator [Parapusillimonas granuli]MBB5213421.1 DNA-binding XRE family transcriptional regulator [Parapusillimonas granuli]MEB2398521.1 helix-turn-helix transcriptional regulator [Alcaligenaceae bacterium]NYT48260.1 helix-turn-helix transcriptional regulator [Parapusillimonas granuli]
MSNIHRELEAARKHAALTQEELAAQAGLSRMTIQRLESGKLDPRFSTLQEIARVLGLDIMLVPASLRKELEAFVRSGGRLLGQAPGADAPPSVVDLLTGAHGRRSGNEP